MTSEASLTPGVAGRPRWQTRIGLVTRVLLLSLAVGLLAGGTALIFRAVEGDGLGTGASSTVKAYLQDVRAGNYSQAYSKLCRGPSAESLDDFKARLADARSRGHAVASFRVGVSFSTETLSLNHTRGTVHFTDGTSEDVDYDLQPSSASGHGKCIDGYDDLTG